MPDHRNNDGRAYTEYCRNIQDAYGPLPRIALPLLREAGRCAVELERLGRDLEAARARRRLRDVRAIGKRQFAAREQLQRLEDRLKSMAAPAPSLAERFAQRRQGQGES